MGDKVLGYPIRDPYPTELRYFESNPNVAGMAASDGQVTLNPFSNLSDEQRAAVAKNEAIRLWLRDNNVDPDFEVTPQQLKSFADSEYGKPEYRIDLKHTLISRYLTGDSSAGDFTEDQIKWADYISKKLPKDK